MNEVRYVGGRNVSTNGNEVIAPALVTLHLLLPCNQVIKIRASWCFNN